MPSIEIDLPPDYRQGASPLEVMAERVSTDRLRIIVKARGVG